MFKRILHEDWTSVVPFIAFTVTFTFFIVIIIHSIRMKKSEREHLSSLPLDDDQPLKK